MLATLIQKYDIIKNERPNEIYCTGCQVPHFMIIYTIYQFIKPFLDNKMSIFKEYGDLNLYGANLGNIEIPCLDTLMPKKVSKTPVSGITLQVFTVIRVWFFCSFFEFNTCAPPYRKQPYNMWPV